jgi:hypothetical protein
LVVKCLESAARWVNNSLSQSMPLPPCWLYQMHKAFQYNHHTEMAGDIPIINHPTRLLLLLYYYWWYKYSHVLLLFGCMEEYI